MLLAILLKTYRFGLIPYNVQIDEAGSIYDAWSLLNYGVDRWRMSWPVYFLNYGSGQNALYTYMLVPLFAVFGISTAVSRIPALISSFMLLASGIGIIWLVWCDSWSAGNRKTAILVYTLLYAIAPYTQLSARIGLESLLMLGFSTFSLFLLLTALKRQQLHFFFLSGLFWGITLYTYAISYIAIPLFLTVAGIFLFRNRLLNVHQAIVLLIPLLLLAVPLLLVQYVNIFQKESIVLGPFTIPRLTKYRGSEFTLSNLWNNFLLTLKSTLLYDWLDYNTVEDFLTFYPVSIPFFFLGIWKHITILRRKQNENSLSMLIFLWFLCMIVIGCTLGSYRSRNNNPNTNKINGIFFAAMFYIVLGLCTFFSNWQLIQWKKIVLAPVLILYIFFSVKFFHYYFVYYTPSAYWCNPYPECAKIIESSESLSQKQVFVISDFIDYLMSSPKSPYEMDFGSSDKRAVYENWRFRLTSEEMEKLAMEYGKDASYLTWDFSEETYDFLINLGFKEHQEGVYTLFYLEDEELPVVSDSLLINAIDTTA